MRKSRCKFCKSFAFHVDMRKRSGRETGIQTEFSAALVSDFFVGQRYHSASTSYRDCGLGWELNFCPECGQKLNWRERMTEHDT